MHKTLTLCLISCFLWTACADHNGSLIATSNGPDAPINQPEDGLFPGDQSGNVTKNPGTGGDDGTQGSGGAGGGDNSGSTGGGSTGGGDTGGNSGGGGSGGGNGGSGGESGGGGGGGQPVPEPSTLLLVGSGLAGAALLRRRRKTAD